MPIYLVSGVIFVGKTTLAKYLVDKYPDQYVELALAKKLKEITFKLLKHFGVSISSVDDLDNRATKEKYRTHLQQIATECFRSTFGIDFWCEQLKKEVDEVLSSGKNPIISDVRFPNEQEYFEKMYPNEQVIKIMITRKGYENKKPSHSSENTSLLKSDHLIENNGSLNDFYKKIEEVVKNNEPVDELISLEEPAEESVIERAVPVIFEEHENTVSYAEKDSTFNLMMNEHNNKNSSQGLGEIGEAYILQLLRKIRPKNDTYDTSSNAHVADIHSIDEQNNIHWVIEVKNKENLTRNDIDKFKEDVINITNHNIKPQMKVIGLFLSIRSTSIPRIGDLFVSQNEIYLSKNYFSPESLEIVFSFVERYKELFNGNGTKNTSSTTVEYTFTPHMLELLTLLNTEYQHLNRDLELFSQIRENSKQTLANIEELTTSTQIKQRLIYLLNQQLNNVSAIITSSTYETQYNQFVEELKPLKSKNKVLKGQTLNKYPELSNKINQLSWKTFLDDAWNLSHHA